MSFFNKQMLNQARDAIKKMIGDSPEKITLYRKPMVDDGFGGLIEDPTGEDESYELTVRLSQERRFAGNYNPAPVGLSTNLARYILSDYESIMYDGETFTSSFDKQYKIGAVNPLIKFEGVTGYEAPLIEAVNLT